MCFLLKLFCNLCKKPKKKLLKDEDIVDNNRDGGEKELLNHQHIAIEINNPAAASSSSSHGANTSGVVNKNYKKMNLTDHSNLSLNLSNAALDATSSATSTSSASSSCNSMTSLNNINGDDKLKVLNGGGKSLCVVVKCDDGNCATNDDECSSKEHHTLIPINDDTKRPQLTIAFGGCQGTKRRTKFEFPFGSTTANMGTFNQNYGDVRPPTKLFDDSVWKTTTATVAKPTAFVSFSEKSGKLTITPQKVYEFDEKELDEIKEIGHGEFGSVYKVLHKPTNTLMALKKIRSTVDEREQLKLIKELNIVMQCNDFTYVVRFYGVKFNNKEGDCLICMELMDTSLDCFYKYIYETMNETIPERILGQILLSTLNALHYLKEKLSIIHRDVKPSNILLNKEGSIKLCDFGISGRLVNSIAQTMDVGCRPYMAPERIDPSRPQRGYDVRSDVWSLGITLHELATGKFPYPHWNSVFEQLHSVVKGEAPRLECDRLSKNFCNFVNTCLTKDDSKRPKYKDLLRHPYVLEKMQKPIEISDYVTSIIDRMNSK